MIKRARWGRTAAISLLLSSALLNHARADNPQCTAPPYGDTKHNYEAVHSDFSQAAVANNLPPHAMIDMLQAALIEACKAKFKHGSRASYYRNGISDADIDAHSTTELANAWFNARNAALAKETAPPPREDDSRIYALFQCLRITGMCTKAASYTFNTLAACQQYARYIVPKGPDPEGRFLMSADQWFECRGKHVDTWDDPAR